MWYFSRLLDAASASRGVLYYGVNSSMMDLREHLYSVLHPHKVNLGLQKYRLGHVQPSLSVADLYQSIQVYLVDKEIIEECVSAGRHISPSEGVHV